MSVAALSHRLGDRFELPFDVVSADGDPMPIGTWTGHEVRVLPEGSSDPARVYTAGDAETVVVGESGVRLVLDGARAADLARLAPGRYVVQWRAILPGKEAPSTRAAVRLTLTAAGQPMVGVAVEKGVQVVIGDDDATVAITIIEGGGPGGGSDITEIVAGEGLTGGGAAGAVSIGLADQGVTAAKLAPDARDRRNHTGTQPIATVDGLFLALNNKASDAAFQEHRVATNPHGVTKATIGLENVPNVDARDRATHTGTQPMSTVTGLQAALAAKLDDASPGAITDLAGTNPAPGEISLTFTWSPRTVLVRVFVDDTPRPGHYFVDDPQPYVITGLEAGTYSVFVRAYNQVGYTDSNAVSVEVGGVPNEAPEGVAFIQFEDVEGVYDELLVPAYAEVELAAGTHEYSGLRMEPGGTLRLAAGALLRIKRN